MDKVSIRQSGGSHILSIPAVAIKKLDLKRGSELSFKIVGKKMVFETIQEDPTLEDLINGSPKHQLIMTEEDHDWINEKPKGKEI